MIKARLASRNVLANQQRQKFFTTRRDRVLFKQKYPCGKQCGRNQFMIRLLSVRKVTGLCRCRQRITPLRRRDSEAEGGGLSNAKGNFFLQQMPSFFHGRLQGLDLLDVQSRIAPVLPEAIFLDEIEPFDLFWDSAKGTFKISRADYLHEGAGGYRLTAFW